MKFMIPCIFSFLITAAITPAVMNLAKACKCLDAPGGRRLHKKTTPRWGGVAFFAGVLPFLFMENISGVLTPYIAASFLLVGMGVIDDLTSLGWKTKLSGMMAAATIVIFGGDIAFHNLGTYSYLGRVDLGWFSIPFTYLSIIGITNAINLLDGLNGLAGGVSLLGFLFMGIAALLAGNMMVALVCFAFVGALAAFLLYNFPNARIFMGDTGSLFLGFSLSLMAILLTQGPKTSVDSMFPLLVLLIPVFDTLRVLLVRLMNGKNPFHADNLHLHFLIVHNNIPPVIVTLLFWSFTAVFGCVALSLTGSSSMSYLNVVLYASLFLSLFAAGLARRQKIRAEATDALLSTGIEADSAKFASYDAPCPGSVRNGGMRAIKWMVPVGIVLMALQAGAEDAPLLKTQRDKVNYAIGVNMVGNFKKQGITIDLDPMIMGMRDALAGGKLLLSDEELRIAINQYQETARQKRSQALAEEERRAKERGGKGGNSPIQEQSK